jgi:3-dehydroquinate synthase
MADRICRVELRERSYDIALGSGNLAGLGEFVTARGKVSHAICITDTNVESHAQKALASLAKQDIATDLLIIEPGEESKAIDIADALWQKLADCGTDRHSVVVAIGGGVIGDLAGFVAATYARGLSFFQVPTTLLAQVDSSVGGKVGVNLPQAKNMVGCFWQPRGVLIDLKTLRTLPDREYRSGLAEVIKYGMILDAALFDELEKNTAHLNARDQATLLRVIYRCCELKAQVVKEDEREETGLRAVLNYGHTYAHALEAVTHYGEWLHGEAVSLGMLCASRLAERLGRIPAEVTARQEKLLAAVGLPTVFPEVDGERLLSAMMRDKKVSHGKLRFILPSQIGHVELVGHVATDDIIAALR